MSAAAIDPREKARAFLRAGVAYMQGDGRGLSLSLLLHGAALALILWFFLHKAPPPPQADLHILPVEVVRIGEETVSPPTPRKAKIPAPVTPARPNRTPASANRPEGTSPHGTKPVDDLETKLRALAHLKNPETNTQPLTAPSASDAAASDAPEGSTAMYAVRDLIRAQVERRWTFRCLKAEGARFPRRSARPAAQERHRGQGGDSGPRALCNRCGVPRHRDQRAQRGAALVAAGAAARRLSRWNGRDAEP